MLKGLSKGKISLPSKRFRVYVKMTFVLHGIHDTISTHWPDIVLSSILSALRPFSTWWPNPTSADASSLCQSLRASLSAVVSWPLVVCAQIEDGPVYGRQWNSVVSTMLCPMVRYGKGGIPLRGHRRDAHLPYWDLWARRWIDHWVCDEWPVRRPKYGNLPSRRASPPFDRYQIIPFGEQRHMCVNNLPKVATWQCSGPELIQGPFSHQSGMLLLHHH